MKIKVSFDKNVLPDTKMLGKLENGLDLFILQEDYEFIFGNSLIINIPSGFIFDYASVPSALHSVVKSISSKSCIAALIHDYLYCTKMFSREICDKIFFEALKVNGQSVWKCYAMYYAVKLFGKTHYENNTDEEVWQDRALAGITEKQIPLYNIN